MLNSGKKKNNLTLVLSGKKFLNEMLIFQMKLSAEFKINALQIIIIIITRHFYYALYNVARRLSALVLHLRANNPRATYMKSMGLKFSARTDL